MCTQDPDGGGQPFSLGGFDDAQLNEIAVTAEAEKQRVQDAKQRCRKDPRKRAKEETPQSSTKQPREESAQLSAKQKKTL